VISEWQILKWLNRYDDSHLSPSVIVHINKIQASYYSDPEKLSFLNELMQYAHKLLDLPERAEIEINCGLFLYARGMVMDAGRCLRNAQQIYVQNLDLHRQAMTEWLLFIIFHGQDDSLTAYYWAGQARNNLWKLARYWSSKDNRRERWYWEMVLELTSDLMSHVRYVYELLFVFHGKRLSPSAHILREKVEELLMDGNQFEAMQKMEALLKITQTAQDKAENAEAYAFCATVQARLGNLSQAVEWYRTAQIKYLPDSHEFTIVQWMQALCEQAIPGRQTRAAVMMETCIQAVEHLAEKADQQNNQSQRIWYEIIAQAMGQTMKRSVARAN
jgi:tetratricopeptide (TPR) repeat protein